MAAPLLPADVASALVDPKAYSQWDELHEKFAWARANMPLAIAENEGIRPFWPVPSCHPRSSTEQGRH
jgi:hypothetical protein